MALQEGNDPAIEETPSTPAETQDAAPQGAIVKGIEEVTDDDPDAILMREAAAAAQAEEAADPSQAQTDPVSGDKQAARGPAPAAPPQGQAQPPQGDGIAIPKARFDEAVSKAKEEAAYWRGVAEARQAAPAQPGQQPQFAQPQATPEQRLAAVEAEMRAAAERADSGEITIAEWWEQLRALQDKERAIRDEARPAASQPAGELAYIAAQFQEQHVNQLEQQHPWSKVFNALGEESDAEFRIVRGLAVESLKASGADPSSKPLLQAEVAKLMDQYGPALLTAKAQAKGIALPGNQPATPPAQQSQQLSPAAQARMAKLGLRESAPPSLAGLGGNDLNASGIPTDAQIEAGLSEEEYDRLPEQTRRRMLGIA